MMRRATAYLAAFLPLVAACEAPTRTVTVHRSNCQVCHAPRDADGQVHGIEQAHPGVELRCTDCHGGTAWVCDGELGGDRDNPDCDGEWVYDKQQAHVLSASGARYLKNLSASELDEVDPDYLRFINPGDFRVADQSCGVCHEHAMDVVPRSTMAHTAGELAVARYRSGAQSVTTGDYGAVAVEDPSPDPDDACTSARLERFEPGAFEFIEGALVVGRGVADAMDQYMAKSCMRCHLSDFGENKFAGDFRSSGCSACHVPYADDGLSQSGDPRISKQSVPHPTRHEIVGPPDNTQCTHCHYRGGRIGISYQGFREAAGPGLSPESPDTLGTTLHGHDPAFYLTDEDTTNDFDETPADVHFEAGMHCVDCHTAEDVHGNGHLYADTQCAVSVRCETCHGSARERAQIVDGGPALEERDGQLILRTKITGLELPVAQVVDLVTPGQPGYSPVAEQSMGVDASGFSHTDQVECYTCHSAWIPSCYGCHVEVDFSASARYQTNGLLLPGRPSGSRSYVALNDLVLMQNPHGKMAPSMPAERFFMTVVGVEQDTEGNPLPSPIRAKPRVFTDSEGNTRPGFGQRTFNPHTVRSRSQFMACDRCHSVGEAENPDNQVLLDITHGFGSQRFPFDGCNVVNEDQSCDPDSDEVTYQLDAVQTRQGDPLVVVGHPFPQESRPLSLEEIARMRQVPVPAGAPFSTPTADDALTNRLWPPAQQLE